MQLPGSLQSRYRRVHTRLPSRSLFRSGFAPLLVVLLASAYPGLTQARSDDLNKDGVIDLEDLDLFSQRRLHQDWETVDWCAWIQGGSRHVRNHPDLVAFIDLFFHCDDSPGGGGDPLAVVGSNDYPARVAVAPDGMAYVSDSRAGSVFIYDPLSISSPVGEIKGLARPMGVAVGPDGHLYVGNAGRKNIEVYRVDDGSLIATIGDGGVLMPTDLAFGPSGNLWVVDSRSRVVSAYDPTTGALQSTVGGGQLVFPIAIEIADLELYVADQRTGLVSVFDLQGDLLRSFGGIVRQGMFSYSWKGKFVRLQDLAFDVDGGGQRRLHAGDCYTGVVQVLDPVTGAYLGVYGTQGKDPGQLNLPLGFALDGMGRAVVSSTLNRRVEVVAIPDPLPQSPPPPNG